MSETVLSSAPVEYPSSDGKPMAENDYQLNAMVYAISALKFWFREREDIYVSGDLLIYYEEGNPGASVAPDVFAVFGAEDRKRMVYKLWEEPKAPDFVLEVVASPSTWREHAERKRDLYAELGVREYWRYDPMGKFLSPVLKGLCLGDGGYVSRPVLPLLDGTVTLHSEVLGLDLRARGGRMRFRDPATGTELPSYAELDAARRAAAAARRAADARADREAAEARVAESEALLAASGKGPHRA